MEEKDDFPGRIGIDQVSKNAVARTEKLARRLDDGSLGYGVMPIGRRLGAL